MSAQPLWKQSVIKLIVLFKNSVVRSTEVIRIATPLLLRSNNVSYMDINLVTAFIYRDHVSMCLGSVFFPPQCSESPEVGLQTTGHLKLIIPLERWGFPCSFCTIPQTSAQADSLFHKPLNISVPTASENIKLLLCQDTTCGLCTFPDHYLC